MQVMIYGCLFAVCFLLPIYTSAVVTESEPDKKDYYKGCCISMLCGCVLSTVLSIAIYCLT